jgi:hypothetical protein
LPLALAKVTEYAEASAHGLCDLLKRFGTGQQSTIPHGSTPPDLVHPLPSDTLKTLTDFIEYSDPPLDVGLLQSTIALIQIHSSRLRQLVKDNHDPSRTTVNILTRTQTLGRIIDAASIYAGVAAIILYSRRQSGQLPVSVSWDDVRRALRNMQIWDEDFPDLEPLLMTRTENSPGPLELLKHV